MKKLLVTQIITLFFFYSSAYAYIYHCPPTVPDYNHLGDQEMWPEVVNNDPTVNGTFHFTAAEYNYSTGEGICRYQCNGCNSQGYCPCNKPGSMSRKGTLLEPIANDNTRWKPSLQGNTASCSGGSEACPWKLKDSVK